MTTDIRTGGCYCGNITYEITVELRPVVACHCTQCRKLSGHYVSATSVSNDYISISGDVTWFRSSPKAVRGFCGTCGSNLFWRPEGENRTAIFAGTIDGDTGLVTEKQIYAEDKGDYYELPDVPLIGQSEI